MKLPRVVLGRNKDLFQEAYYEKGAYSDAHR